MTLRARDRLVKLLRKRGLRINDTITTALDSFLIEVREQQSARSADVEDDDSEEKEDDEDDDLESGDDDDAEDDDADLDEDEDEDEAEDDAEKDVGADVEKSGWDVDGEEGETPSPKAKKGGKKPPEPIESEGEEAPEEERTLVQEVTCPHCGERIPLILDLSGGDQDDIQDCEVCCSPIRVTYTVTQGALGALSIEAS